MAVMTAFSKYRSRNFPCLASGRTTCRTLKAWTLVISLVAALTFAISIRACTPRSERSRSPVMRDRMEYGKAADRRVVDSASSRTVRSSCYMVSTNLIVGKERLTSSHSVQRSLSSGEPLTTWTRDAKAVASLVKVPLWRTSCIHVKNR
jgi:hypothetical protein